MTSKEWMELIAKEFKVSNSTAKEMYHVMLSVYKTNQLSSYYRKTEEKKDGVHD